MLSLVFCTAALAQGVAADRPVIPSSGIAAEGGPGMAWVNPAHLAYDPDPRYAVLLTQDLGSARTTVAFTGGVGTFSAGARNTVRRDGTGDWAIDSAVGIPLPERLALGVRVDWHLVTAGRNFLGYDVGAAWRPLPWFGAAVVTRNIGNPDPSVTAASGFGLAVRPFADALVVSGEWMRSFPGRDALVTDVWTAAARIRPVEGLFVRASIDSDLAVGAGLEFYFGGVGAGGHGLVQGDARSLTTWIGTDEPGESLLRSGRRIATVDLRAFPPYEPEAGLFSPPDPSWLDTLELLRRLEEDRGVRGVVIALDDAPASMARLREVRDRITSLRQTGKRVTVYLDGDAGNGAYYVASAATEILLHPSGGVSLTGVSSALLTARGALDRVGVVPQYAKRSEYKSAPETFTETEPTSASLEQASALLDDLYEELVTGIAAGRGRTPEEVTRWVDSGPWTPGDALAAGLVDALLYPDEVDARLEGTHDGPVRITRLQDAPQPRSAWVSPSQIAVIVIDGPIVEGESSRGGLLSARTAGSETVSTQLLRAGEDPQVKAIVLRVDSPGGSALASDDIWRTIERVKESGKPVVVSMGGVAASGGYWVSMGADAIWAEPSTITGSIGVFSGKFDVGPLMERLGVQTTTLARGRAATLWSATQSWDPVEQARVQHLVDDVYERFLDKVAAGRDLPREDVDDLAGGRVWSGRRAAELGLVDHLGGLQDAVSDARERAGLPPRREVALVTYAPDGGRLQALSPTLLRAHARRERARAAEDALPPEIAVAFAPLRTWMALSGSRVLAVEPLVIDGHLP